MLQLNRGALLASGEHPLGVGPKLLSGLQPLYADHTLHDVSGRNGGQQLS